MPESTPQVILLTGDDIPRISAAAEQYAVQLAGENPSPFDLDVCQESDTKPVAAVIADVLGSIQTPPFLGGHKTVWLKHFSAFGSEEGAKASKPEGLALKSLATAINEGLPDNVTLLLDGAGCDGRKALYKACEKHGQVQSFNRPDTSKSGRWQAEMEECLAQAAVAKGMLPLESSVLSALVESLGADTSAIDSALEKLICHAGGPQEKITVDDVRLLCPGNGEEQFFALNEAIGQHRLDSALSVLERLLSGEPDQDRYARQLLSASSSFFLQLLRVRLFMAENRLKRAEDVKSFLYNLPADKKPKGRSDEDILTYHPYRAMKLAEGALNFTPHELIQALKAVRDANWQINSSAITPRLALENALTAILGK
ncbi:MAG: hypothetical protein J6866_01235 [Victivallales bacterium]|jgi:DNA polymerase III delta subunit|nr:hypothetical protein [Victivallales bacterium]